MAHEIRMPKMGLTMTTAAVGRWLKQEGDPVAKGDDIVEVMTDKITNVIEAAADGVLLKIAAPEGTELEALGLLGFIGQPGEAVPDLAAGPAADADVAAPAPAAAPAPRQAGERIIASPLARRIAREQGLDLALVTGTGPQGRIVKKDVEAALASGASAAPAAPCAALCEEDVLERIPYVGMRKAVGANMAAAAHSVPRVTHQSSVPMDKLMALRAQLNAGREGAERFTVTDLLVKITATALSRFPSMNAHFTGEHVVRYRAVHVGVAVALDEGLVVPVVKNADGKSLSAVSREIKALAAKAKARQLQESDLTGGTFTVSNVGASRSVDHFTPIINLPQVGILGVGRTRESPWVENGELVVRPVAGLSLTFDHRAVDGAPAAEFLALLHGLILDPVAAVI